MTIELDISREVLSSYGFYSGLLAFKMLSMALLTARQRFSKKVFANPEDAMTKGTKVKYDDPDVERVRRAHLNDIENIFLFFPIGFLYCLTNPALSTATLVFRVFTIGRYLHTLVYAVFVIPQPARFLAFFVAHVCNIYMTLQILLHFK